MDGGRENSSTLRGRQSNSNLFYTSSGWIFFRYKTTDSAIYFRCNKFRDGCAVRSIYYRWTGDLKFSGQHNHLPDQDDIPFRIERMSLLQEARRLDIASLHDIFNNPRNVNGLYADRLSYHRLQPSMSRARLEVLPVCNTLRQLIEALENPQFRSITAVGDFTEILYRGFKEAQDGTVVSLFMSPTCCDMLRILPSVHISLTQVLVGGQQHKICTISGRWDKFVFPLAWSMMDGETHDTYCASFNLLRESLVTWQFVRVTCGDESVSNAFSFIFNVPVHPSLYDYINDLKLFKERALNMADLHVSNIVKLCCGLPLLPWDQLQVGLDVIFAHAKLPHEPEISESLQGLFSLIEVHWIQKHQRIFSVCGSDERTDFASEQLKMKINQKIGTVNDFYCLTKFLVSTTQESLRDIHASLSGNRRRNVHRYRCPMSQENDIIVLLKQLIRPAFSTQFAVRNLLNVAGEKLFFLL